MKTRIGKIARLPRAIRNQLNARLHDGEQGQRLIEWLNALPEVQTVLAAEFEGRPVNAQNFSDWKKGGYREWVLQQEALELAERLAEDAVELQAEGRPPLTDTLALWLATRYAVATRAVSAQDGPEQWRQLRELCADVVDLRCGDHSAERLRLEREHLELLRAKEHERTEEEFWEWARKNRGQICQGFVPAEERMRRIRKKLFGTLPEDAVIPGNGPLPAAVVGPADPPPAGTPASIQGESR
ncbi:MAG: hypothetical protein NT105_04055 [Verrucomicrobia bacterium]|nr:hypothetical protein [Verrucomicrobiota bacterium]